MCVALMRTCAGLSFGKTSSLPAILRAKSEELQRLRNKRTGTKTALTHEMNAVHDSFEYQLLVHCVAKNGANPTKLF